MTLDLECLENTTTRTDQCFKTSNGDQLCVGIAKFDDPSMSKECFDDVYQRGFNPQYLEEPMIFPLAFTYHYAIE